MYILLLASRWVSNGLYPTVLAREEVSGICPQANHLARAFGHEPTPVSGSLLYVIY